MAINKVIYGGNTLIDLTDTSAVASDVLSGKYFYGRDGVKTEGTCTYNADTSDATAVAADILSGSSAYVNGNKITGTMVNNGAVTGTITTKAQQYTIPVGYHDGSGKVSIATSEQNKIIAANIKSGITILGVEGTMSGQEDMNAQAKTATPTFSSQVISPDTGYNCLSQVTVAAIAVTYSDNAAGGKTVTIGTAA